MRPKGLMAMGISRRGFLMMGVGQCRKPLRILSRVVIVAVVAWLALHAIRIGCDISLGGWRVAGVFAVAALLFIALYSIAVCIYARLPKRGQTFCDAIRMGFVVLFLIALGVLVWSNFKSGNSVGGFSLLMMLIVVVSELAGRACMNNGGKI